jgi:hypothetical protein
VQRLISAHRVEHALRAGGEIDRRHVTSVPLPT